MDSIRLVQLNHKTEGRKVALVKEPNLVLLHTFTSIYDLATYAIENRASLLGLVGSHLSETVLDYEVIYERKSVWKLLPAFDHPDNVHQLMLSGTGLTHKASAENRQKMHEAQQADDLTDSMRMYLLGVQGGTPPKGTIGAQPEWFYKGNGTVLRAHGETLAVPAYADDGGEEPEIVGLYLNDNEGNPWRIGFATANEFSDHVMERKNYLYLAPSKIRNCSIGPELVLGNGFGAIEGTVRILRGKEVIWERTVHTGEKYMAHSLENLEHHHFKYANHRVPGQAHIHFYGADAFSFGEQLVLQQGDTMEVRWKEMGRALRNPLEIHGSAEELIAVRTFP